MNIKEHLEKIAAEEIPVDKEDFVVDDYAGGNVDDAFWAGVSTGKVLFARELLAKEDKL